MSAVMSLDRTTLEIGSIRDIAFAVPIEDFLNLRFPDNISLHFPMRNEYEQPSNFDSIVKWTREQMAEWHPVVNKVLCTIY